MLGFTLFAELRGRDTRELSRIFKLFWIPPPKNQGTRKNTCQNFPTQKHSEIENATPQRSFDLPSLSLEIRSHSPGTRLLIRQARAGASPGRQAATQATWKTVASYNFRTLPQYHQICGQDTYRLTFCNFSACFRSHCCCFSCFSFTTWPPHPQT